MEKWRQETEQRQQKRHAADDQLAIVEGQMKKAFELCCHLVAAQQAAQCNPWDCCATDLFQVSMASCGKLLCVGHMGTHTGVCHC
jgi:hypothetical protein